MYKSNEQQLDGRAATAVCQHIGNSFFFSVSLLAFYLLLNVLVPGPTNTVAYARARTPIYAKIERRKEKKQHVRTYVRVRWCAERRLTGIYIYTSLMAATQFLPLYLSLENENYCSVRYSLLLLLLLLFVCAFFRPNVGCFA